VVSAGKCEVARVTTAISGSNARLLPVEGTAGPSWRAEGATIWTRQTVEAKPDTDRRSALTAEGRSHSPPKFYTAAIGATDGN